MLCKLMSYAPVIDLWAGILFRRDFMSITEKISSFPEYAKDIKLNYSKILNEQILNKQQLYSIILISSITTGMKDLIEVAEEDAKNYIDNSLIESIYGAYSIMSMNSIYYRFTHLATNSDYSEIPANLRMQFLSKHKMDKADFEMLCLSVAIIIGCGKCINAHESILRENNITNQTIQTVARITSVIYAISNVLRVLK